MVSNYDHHERMALKVYHNQVKLNLSISLCIANTFNLNDKMKIWSIDSATRN